MIRMCVRVAVAGIVLALLVSLLMPSTSHSAPPPPELVHVVWLATLAVVVGELLLWIIR